MINSTGLPRRIDHLGRIVVPVELRRMLGINAGDELEIAVKGDAITLTPVRQGCVFCGAEDDLHFFHDKPVCGGC
ncbi:MAG TPA: AbrB/MazE/SpoVT family DNA-binding domain-containing protein, partial [Acidimicrobiales bacterium]|nr:AbrB/MazE/SpoVT family DNA-binding domain-containing protein [Acidimicrobiales bacterium]